MDFSTQDKRAESPEEKLVKLAVLIGSLEVDEETRQSFIDILPEMSPEQIDEFVALLEMQYADSQTRHVDAQFLKEVERVVVEHDKKQLAQSRSQLAELQALEAEIKRAQAE